MKRIDIRWLIPIGMLAIMGVASTTPNYPVTPKWQPARITNASGTAAVTFFAGASAVTKVIGMACASDDTSNHNITLQRTRSATSYPVTTFQVPATAGTAAGVAPVNVMSYILGLPGGGEPFFYVESSDTLEIKSGDTVTSGKFVSCWAVTADFS